MFDETPDRYEPRQSLKRRLLVPAVAVGGILGAGALAFVLLRPSGSPMARPHQEPHITQIQLPPPPPPPPLKPPPEPQKKQLEKPKEQMPSPHKASVPKAAPKTPSPPAAVTTSITGPGPGSLAAGNGGGGDCLGAGCGSGDGGGGGDDEAYYDNIIATQIRTALQRSEKLRYAKYDAQAVISVDASGHLTAVLQSFKGTDEDEEALRRELLGIALTDHVPADYSGRPHTLHIREHA